MESLIRVDFNITLDIAAYILDKICDEQLIAFRMSSGLPEPTVFFSTGQVSLYVNISSNLVIHDDIELRQNDRQIYWARHRAKAYRNNHTKREVSHW